MPDRRHEPTARTIVEHIERGRNPDASLAWEMERLDHRIESAERERQYSEALLIEVMAKLERIAKAKRAAERAQRRAQRLRWEQEAERQRVARNARRRQRYRERADPHPSGSGRSVRIEVDTNAWRAMRAEAARRGIPAKVLLGEIVRGVVDEQGPGQPSAPPAPRWRRTGDGRRARQSTLIEAEDDTWARVRARAVLEGLTVARLVGSAVEQQVSEHHWSTTWPVREPGW